MLPANTPAADLPAGFWKTTLTSAECAPVFKHLFRDRMNQVCFDCGGNSPTWASANNGIFLCITCAGYHRDLSMPDVSFVRSVQLDSWYVSELLCVWLSGNAKTISAFRAGNVSCLGKGNNIRDIMGRFKSFTSVKYRENLLAQVNHASRNPAMLEALAMILKLVPTAIDKYNQNISKQVTTTTVTTPNSTTTTTTTGTNIVSPSTSSAPTTTTTTPTSTVNPTEQPAKRIIIMNNPTSKPPAASTFQLPTFVPQNTQQPQNSMFLLPSFHGNTLDQKNNVKESTTKEPSNPVPTFTKDTHPRAAQNTSQATTPDVVKATPEKPKSIPQTQEKKEESATKSVPSIPPGPKPEDKFLKSVQDDDLLNAFM